VTLEDFWNGSAEWLLEEPDTGLLIMDLPGNVGVGHADIVLVGGATYLYTATPAYVRGRYVLVRR
jgi:hypothetical protein